MSDMEKAAMTEIDHDEEVARLDGNYLALRYMREVRRLGAEVDGMRKHVAYNDEEYAVVKDVLRAEHEECKRLRAEVEGMRRVYEAKHPMAPERCPDCEWSNTNLMNYGVPGKSIWLCHGCAGRRIRGEAAIDATRGEG